MISSILSILSVVQNIYANATIELTTESFKKDVLGNDNTYFVMFYMTNCEPCHDMMPQLEKLAKNMKAIGIKVGQINLDNYPEIATTYQCTQVPKLLLFRPNKEPLEYAKERSAKAMGKFINDNQLGQKQITLLSNDKILDKFFNTSAKIPRVLLFSSKSTIPPMFKQLCYKHRRGVMCGYSNEQDDNVEKVWERVKNLQDEDDEIIEEFEAKEKQKAGQPEEPKGENVENTEEQETQEEPEEKGFLVEYPTVFFLDWRANKGKEKKGNGTESGEMKRRIVRYNGKINFAEVHKRVLEFALVKPKEDMEAERLAEQKRRQQADRERVREDRKKRQELKEKKKAARKDKKKKKAQSQREDDDEL
ncbi:Protein disulfide-isomerase [Monocercomonoides exilis]|uniref:Protein disulfide-isomerase n=1 Tax=Monocercomonoides exilis TaxID=2049356 RepID=UPI003559902D|nr:Protein disulfide-isomerase [Monocercomonoides exilis]|eukprot:MONOS_5719.1-p1 / transcript=MONOS_5719.1 / gene=MONOS_5719 / organism=Monocercomonoides_exilis_PA203 / gene_product=Protein disulfide-isomerase / transcript_product=Protein disulfide-isomerase / location=Mono_scaffold00170:53956-55099(+) / protein_length=363 / sequence_SO=supercontig / SO=protein_coding / is_pseudo=false